MLCNLVAHRYIICLDLATTGRIKSSLLTFISSLKAAMEIMEYEQFSIPGRLTAFGTFRATWKAQKCLTVMAMPRVYHFRPKAPVPAT
jgi:hypothetical protein